MHSMGSAHSQTPDYVNTKMLYMSEKINFLSFSYQITIHLIHDFSSFDA